MRVITILCSFVLLQSCTTTKWADSIRNPENTEYVIETGFQLGKLPIDVTQKEFNERYLNSK